LIVSAYFFLLVRYIINLFNDIVPLAELTHCRIKHQDGQEQRKESDLKEAMGTYLEAGYNLSIRLQSAEKTKLSI
jgi:hypothetical protein